MTVSPTSAHGSGTTGATEVGYVEFTAPVSVTATVEASSDTIVTAAAFTADGVSAYLITFSCPDAFPSSAAAGRNLRICLFQDGTTLGHIAVFQTPAAANSINPIERSTRLIPSAGSRTYSIRAFVNAGTGTVDAGTGGSGNLRPGYIRISKVT